MHKAEHAVDVDTGAFLAVTIQGADHGDTTTAGERLVAAAEQVVADWVPSTTQEVIADEGCHRNETMAELMALELRSHVAEPDRARRAWSKAPAAQGPVCRNRRRLRGVRRTRLQRRRGELVERPFAHVYDTDGTRRTHLRGHGDICTRLIVHASGFNVGLLSRALVGVGKPRRLQGAAVSALLTLLCVVKPLHAARKASLAGVVEILSPVTTATWPRLPLWHCPAERH